MDNNPYIPPSAESAGAKTSQRQIATTLLRLAGAAMLLYWLIHFLQGLLYWNLYVAQEASNPLLGPYFRSFVALAAVAAGGLMFWESKWLLIPFAAHCIAYTWMMLSIAPFFDWAIVPTNVKVTRMAQAAIAMLVGWMLIKKKL
jgi:hypothetical protein